MEKKIRAFVKAIDDELEKDLHPVMRNYFQFLKKEVLRYDHYVRQTHFEEIREEISRPYLGTYLDPEVAPEVVEPETAED